MPWATGFEIDIFISYARVDDLSVNPHEPGWVTQFLRHVEVALSKKIGQLNAVTIWRDTRDLHGNQRFDQTIRDAIQRSAIFVGLCSNGYLASEYCRDELDYFYRVAQQQPVGLAAGDLYRIFPVFLHNVRPSTWPPEFGRITGFQFHDAPDATTSSEPLEPADELFRSRLRSLVEAIYQTLLRLRTPLSAAPQAAAERKFCLYLADTADSLGSVRKRVLNELKPVAGLDVITGIPPPFEEGQHDTRVRDVVEKADLSVHLLDIYPGREMVDCDGAFYPRQQLELALRHGRSQFIWMSESRAESAAEDTEYAAFLDRLENGPRAQASYQFLRDLPGAITRQVLVRVDELRSQHKAAVAPQSALLDTHFKDQFHALELSSYLLRHDVQPWINPQEDDPAKNLDIFTERLKQVGILILFYGEVAEEWIRSRLAVALQIAITEKCPLRACGVYVAPPRKEGFAERLRLPLVPVEWMDNTAGFNAAAVDQLLARARMAGAGL